MYLLVEKKSKVAVVSMVRSISYPGISVHTSLQLLVNIERRLPVRCSSSQFHCHGESGNRSRLFQIAGKILFCTIWKLYPARTNFRNCTSNFINSNNLSKLYFSYIVLHVYNCTCVYMNDVHCKYLKNIIITTIHL